jgi:energy-converting hydrogenase Eha subunit F
MNTMTTIFLNNLNGIIIILVLVLIALVGLVVVENENKPKLFPKKRPIVSMQ